MDSTKKSLTKKVIAFTLGITVAFSALMLPCGMVRDSFAAASAFTYEVNGCTYTYDIEKSGGEEIVVLKGVEGHGETVEIPSVITHEGVAYPVTKIATDFLKRDQTVKTVIFPGSVKIIGISVLYGSSVENIVLPDGLEKLDRYFAGECLNLRSVEYNGSKITKGNMGSDIFINSDLSYITNDKGAVCLGNWLIRYVPKEGGKLVKLSELGNDGTKIDKIGYEAIHDLPDICTLDLEGIKYIDDHNFYNTANLTDVINDESVREINGDSLAKTPWFEKAKEDGLVRIGNVLLYYKTDSDTIDLTSGKLRLITQVKTGALADCANAENIYLKGNCKLEYRTLYVDHAQEGEGESRSDSIPVIPTYKIKKVYLDGSELTYDRLMKEPDAYEWLRSNGSQLSQSAYINSLVEEKTKIIFEQMDIPFYGMFNEKKTSYTPSEEFYIRLRIHNYMSLFDFDLNADFPNPAIGFILNGKMVCSNYAEITDYLLKCAGVDSKIPNGPGHAWNYTRIGDEWFESDDGWDEQGGHLYGWLLLSSSAMKHYTLSDSHNTLRVYDSFHVYLTSGYETDIINAQRTLGDTDGDDDRDADDVSILWAYIKGETSDIDKKAADVNFDGTVDVTDAVLLDNFVSCNAIDTDNIPADGSAPSVRVAFLNGTDYDDIKYLYTDNEGYITLPDGLFEVPEGMKLRYDIGKPGQKVRITRPLSVVRTKWVDKNAPEYELGDVNGDGTIDIEDAVSIIQHINGMTPLTVEQEERADVSKDDSIDIDDAVMLISYVNGNSTF